MTTKTVAEQIAAFEAKRAACTARMTEIMGKSAEELRTLDAAETTEYDALKLEAKQVGEHIARLKEHEAHLVETATPITTTVTDDPAKAALARSGIISVGRKAAPGSAFTRFVIALARTRGNIGDAYAVAANNKGWHDTTPEVEVCLKAAVAAGTTTDAAWAAPLVAYQLMASEFIELLRPQTIIGKMTGIRRVPFNVRMASQTSGSSVAWVGEGQPKPVGKLGFGEVTLRWAKAAGIVVLTEELVRSSSPDAELVVRGDLTGALAQFLDEQFVNPAIAEVANVSPASITNGLAANPASGVTVAAARADVQEVFATYITANLNPASAVWIMSPTTALALSMIANPLGQAEYPGITMNGGVWFGLPVIVSMSVVAGNIILANANEIMLADDGQVVIDASREATLQMDGAPVADTTAVNMVSMFQTNQVAIRAERWINWKKRRAAAVALITGAAYTG
jgi:HK97 family phage major capsid protein